MRTITAVLALCLALQGSAQQKKFLPPGQIKVMVFTIPLNEVFQSPETYITLSCNPEDLDSASKFDLRKLENLEVLHIEFALDPASTDKQKDAYIDTLVLHLKNLKYFSAAPNLKRVMLGVGEQIFLSEKEVKACGDDYEKMFDLNLVNAWKVLGSKVQAELPKVKIHGYTWGW